MTNPLSATTQLSSTAIPINQWISLLVWNTDHLSIHLEGRQGTRIRHWQSSLVQSSDPRLSSPYNYSMAIWFSIVPYHPRFSMPFPSMHENLHICGIQPELAILNTSPASDSHCASNYMENQERRSFSLWLPCIMRMISCLREPWLVCCRISNLCAMARRMVVVPGVQRDGRK